MSHISNDVLQLQIEGYRAMTPERKLEIAAGLRAFAWATRLANLRLGHPDLSAEEGRALVGEIFGNASA